MPGYHGSLGEARMVELKRVQRALGPERPVLTQRQGEFARQWVGDAVIVTRTLMFMVLDLEVKCEANNSAQRVGACA